MDTCKQKDEAVISPSWLDLPYLMLNVLHVFKCLGESFKIAYGNM